MRTSFSLPNPKSSWSMDDIRTLRALAAEGLPLEVIAKRMRRSASAIRNKAGMHGVALRTNADGYTRQTGVKREPGRSCDMACGRRDERAECV